MTYTEKVPDEKLKEIGKILSEAREKAGFNKSQMAREVGADYKAVLRWERDGNVTLKVILLYAQVTGESIVIS